MSDKIDCKFLFAASSTEINLTEKDMNGFMRRIKYYEENQKNKKGGKKHYGGTRKGTINKG